MINPGDFVRFHDGTIRQVIGIPEGGEVLRMTGGVLWPANKCTPATKEQVMTMMNQKTVTLTPESVGKAYRTRGGWKAVQKKERLGEIFYMEHETRQHPGSSYGSDKTTWQHTKDGRLFWRDEDRDDEQVRKFDLVGEWEDKAYAFESSSGPVVIRKGDRFRMKDDKAVYTFDSHYLKFIDCTYGPSKDCALFSEGFFATKFDDFVTPEKDSALVKASEPCGTRPQVSVAASFKIGDRVMYEGHAATIVEDRTTGLKSFEEVLIEFDTRYGHHGTGYASKHYPSGRVWYANYVELTKIETAAAVTPEGAANQHACTAKKAASAPAAQSRHLPLWTEGDVNAYVAELKKHIPAVREALDTNPQSLRALLSDIHAALTEDWGTIDPATVAAKKLQEVQDGMLSAAKRASLIRLRCKKGNKVQNLGDDLRKTGAM